MSVLAALRDKQHLLSRHVTRRTKLPSLMVGLLIDSATKVEGLQFPEALRVGKTSNSNLTLNLFNARIELKFELSLGNTLVLRNVCQSYGGRIVVLFDHLGLHWHAAAIDPNLDIVVAGRGLGHGFEVRSCDTTPEGLFAHVLQIAEPSLKLSRRHI